jgi:biopolymer transport protein ExbB
MGSLAQIWSQGDGVIRAVSLLLLAMSVAAWVVILWKGWLLARVRGDLKRALPAFWAAADLDAARRALASLDREAVLLPLLEAAREPVDGGTLDGANTLEARLTRRLRDALHQVLARLAHGQVLLASVGATAPFVGLFGTVWGLYHALLGLAGAQSLSLERIAGPIGETLVMTAAGLAVAIPAVLAYNLFGRWIGQCEAELEGHAHDLRGMLLERAAAPAAAA